MKNVAVFEFSEEEKFYVATLYIPESVETKI